MTSHLHQCTGQSGDAALQLLKLLVRYGATEADGIHPLIPAYANREFKILAFSCKYCGIHERNKILRIALLQEDMEMVQLLIEAGADIPPDSLIRNDEIRAYVNKRKAELE